MKILSTTPRSVGKSKCNILLSARPIYHIDVLRTSISSFRVGYSRHSGSLVNKRVHPTFLKEAEEHQNQEIWVQSLAASHFKCLMPSDLRFHLQDENTE